MPFNTRYRRLWADPPNNESGTTGTDLSYDSSCRNVSSGNGSCISAKTFSNEEPWNQRRRILSTRSRRSSAATTLSISSGRPSMSSTKRGKGGQISSVSRTGVLAVQRSRSLRRRGDPKTTLRHRRQTCTSDCHHFAPNVGFKFSSIRNSNTSSRISSGRMSIDFTWPTLHRVGQQLLRDGGEQKTHVSSQSGDESLTSTSLPEGTDNPGRVEND
jgi:hypothetical protein